LLKSAAKRRDLPHECVSGQHLRLGQGVRQRQLFSSLTSSTSFSAVKMALDKRQSNRRLSELSLPVPLQLSVASAEEAVAALGFVGTPAVIKPIKGNQGRGVTTGIRQPEKVTTAFEHALSEESGVLVETWVPGTDYRLLVVGGRFVAALTCLPPSVEGDGRRTLRDLIDELNREPDRDDIRLSPVPLDAHLERHLFEQGCSVNAVPAQGRVISLRANGHVATGGIPIDVTDRVHPDNQNVAEKAALAIGLEVAGVDFVTTDITRSYREIGGRIIEVNSRPGLGMHVWPREGKSRDVAGAILDFVFPDRRSAFVPIMLVAGDRGTSGVARAVEGLLRAKGLAVGLGLKGGAYLNGLPLDLVGSELAQAPKILLRDPFLECLVSVVSLRRAMSHGLHLETCDAAAILPREHHDDLRAFESGIEILRKANSGRFVISTRNREARAALAAVDPSRLILISAQSHDAEINEHIAAGRSAILKTWRREGPTMTLVEGGREVTSAPLKGEAHARSNSIQASMYAFALVHAAGLGGSI
jgi:cyanophycin synthetase